MACKKFTMPDGTTGFSCTRGNERCDVCRTRPGTLLCDGPAPPGSGRATCDRRLCAICARHVASDRDLCPECAPRKGNV